MKLCSYSFITLLSSLVLFSSCQKKETESAADSPKSEAITIELLSHKNGKFTVADTVTVTPDQTGFAIGEKSFTIKSRWSDAEVKRETLNNNPKEAHAVEMKWVDPKNKNEHSEWIFPVGSEEGAPPLLSGTNVQARLLSPGSRLLTTEEAKSKSTPLVDRLQFHWKNKRYDLPELGQEVFSGWKLVSLKEYQHALLNDDSTLSESEDASFVNRAVQVVIEAKDGSKERHVCFIDHPKLTEGIHPSLLPVSRVSGNLTSLSRLYVCETLKAPAEKSLLLLSPSIDGKMLTVWTWLKGDSTANKQTISQLPTELKLGEQAITLTRHWTKARRQIKWQEKTGAKENERHPALVVETGGHIHRKSAVLVKGQPTPVEIAGDMLILRYR